MSIIKIGTMSWKYQSWYNLVYSKPKDINYLEEYSKKYNTVEIDQWFWSLFHNASPKLPDINTVEEYNNAVDNNFTFTIKVPNSITLTHYYKGKNPGLITNPYYMSINLFNDFLKKITPLKSKTAILMFQFEYLNKQKKSSLKEFLNDLDTFFKSVPKEYKYGVEIRNPNYLKNEYFDFIDKTNLIHVFIQGYYMPDITEIYNNFKAYIKNTSIIRLHGYDRKKIEDKTSKKWDKIVTNHDDELIRISEMINDMKNKKMDIYININNHYEGSAPLTIEKIKKLI